MTRVRDTLFGRPLPTDEQYIQQIGPRAGVPVLGLDALASASYGPEAALTALIALGATANIYILPITATILVLLVLLFCRTTRRAAYPGGGGSFTVAKENLRPALPRDASIQ